jgi:hypothetical protein
VREHSCAHVPVARRGCFSVLVAGDVPLHLRGFTLGGGVCRFDTRVSLDTGTLTAPGHP